MRPPTTRRLLSTAALANTTGDRLPPAARKSPNFSIANAIQGTANDAETNSETCHDFKTSFRGGSCLVFGRASCAEGANGSDSQDIASVSGRHDRPGRLPGPALPQVRSGCRRAHRRCLEIRDLPRLILDENERAILGFAKRGARFLALSAGLRRGRSPGDESRPHAMPRHDLRTGREVERCNRRKISGAHRGREGREIHQLDMAVWRHCFGKADQGSR